MARPVNAFLMLVEKLATRPSITWRLAWLIFCLLATCLAGSSILPRVFPYVIAGLTDQPFPRLLILATGQSRANDGWFLTWGLPAFTWSILSAVLTRWLFA